MDKSPITIETEIKAPIQKVWKYWNEPSHIEKWAFAAEDWEASGAENDLRVGGTFKTTMSAKDKSASFDFGGVYNSVIENELIEYDMDDSRHVSVKFSQTADGTKIIQTFDPENENPEELQKSGWQSILNNFKNYAENN